MLPFVHGISSCLLLLLLFHRWPYSVPAFLWFDCQLLLGFQLVCCWNCWSDRCTHGIVVSHPVVFRVPWSRNKMIQLRLRSCVLLASLSSAHHWSEHKCLGRALSFLSRDFVHFVLLVQNLLLRARHRCQRIHPESWHWSMFFVNFSK